MKINFQTMLKHAQVNKYAIFSSVMLNYCHHNTKENIEKTKAIVNFAAPLGISVEAEMGGCQSYEIINYYIDNLFPKWIILKIIKIRQLKLSLNPLYSTYFKQIKLVRKKTRNNLVFFL